MTEDKILELASTHVYNGWLDDDNVIEFAKSIQREALLEAADNVFLDHGDGLDNYFGIKAQLRRMAGEAE